MFGRYISTVSVLVTKIYFLFCSTYYHHYYYYYYNNTTMSTSCRPSAKGLKETTIISVRQIRIYRAVAYNDNNDNNNKLLLLSSGRGQSGPVRVHRNLRLRLFTAVRTSSSRRVQQCAHVIIQKYSVYWKLSRNTCKHAHADKNKMKKYEIKNKNKSFGYECLRCTL